MSFIFQRNAPAFTLIELLIVVAIIGILAAIAVPNFLSAQVRAKVARTKADMRSISTALETYRINYNSYPPDGDDLPNFNPMDFDTAARLKVLTTPIAFMSNLPNDPFHANDIEFPPETGIQLLFPNGGPYTYIYTTFGNHAGDERQAPNLGKPNNYGLSSLGPNQIFNAFIGYPILYDMSNGVVSDGDITIVGGERTPLSPQ